MTGKGYRVYNSKWQSNNTDELYHHGIKGQKWGVRHGPPYPLKASQRTGYKGIGKESNVRSEKKNENNSSNQAFEPRLRNQFERINESLEQSLKKTNPLRGTQEGRENCSSCVIAGHMRRLGYDATAKAVTPPFPSTLDSILTDSFPGVKIKSVTAKDFGSSPEKAENVLKKRFGDNASGIVGYTNSDGDGHVFNWSIKNGTVSFVDFQKGWNDRTTRKKLWSSFLEPAGSIEFARLDNVEFNDAVIADKIDIKKLS